MTMIDADLDLEPEAAACVERVRSSVLNVLVAVGAGIAASGWILGRLDAGALSWNPVTARYGAMAALIAILVAGRVVLRVGSSRTALRAPGSRANRFARAHVASAIVGGLAVPLGFAYGWGIRPSLEAIAPFWVVALANGFLALPRAQELADFDEPMPGPDDRSPSPPIIGEVD